MNYSSIILGTGSYLPSTVLTNYDLSRTVDTSDEWIYTRTGIKSRHIAAPDETTSDLAVMASIEALKSSNLNASEIDCIICATVTPDLTCPSTATIIQAKLGASNAYAFDISAACSGFVYALSTADALIKSSMAKNILVIGAEVFSRLIDWTDRNTCVLFGDGAGAMVLTRTESISKKGILSSSLGSDGTLTDILKTTGGVSSTKSIGHIIMEGRSVFKVATQKMSALTLEISKSYNIDYIIPHQANVRIIDFLAETLQLNIDKFIISIETHANTSAASIPLAMDCFVKKGGKLKDKNIFLTAVGAGMTWGGVLIAM